MLFSSNKKEKEAPSKSRRSHGIPVDLQRSATNRPTRVAVGPYLFCEVIGKGSFATVRRCVHEKTKKEYAVKIIYFHSPTSCKTVSLDSTQGGGDTANAMTVREKELFDQAQFAADRELQIAKKNLRHKNLVQLYDSQVREDGIFLVMDLVRGKNIQQMIDEHGCFTESQCRKLFSQLTSALTYLHDRGIAHRDIKTENLLLKSKNELRLADFGLSEIAGVNIPHYNGRPESDAFCGTPGYMAPEVSGGKTRYNPLMADVWSCGVVLFEMLTGYHPFLGTAPGIHKQATGVNSSAGCSSSSGGSNSSDETGTASNVTSVNTAVTDYDTDLDSQIQRDDGDEDVESVADRSQVTSRKHAHSRHADLADKVRVKALKKDYTYPAYVRASVKSLVDSMLEPDPAKRASMVDVSHHPWLKEKSKFSFPLCRH